MGILNSLVESLEGRKVFNQERLITSVTERLLEIMEEKGISQRHLAKILKVKPPRVSKMLSGNSNITLRTLADLGTALDVEIHFRVGDGFSYELEQLGKHLTRVERVADDADAFREFEKLRDDIERKINEKKNTYLQVAGL